MPALEWINEKKGKMEIERKFLIDDFPTHLPLLEKAVTQQGYLCTKPVVRIRKKQVQGKDDTFVLCFKGKGTLARQEVELALDRATYEQLEELVPGEMIEKDYRVYGLPNGLRLECSLVDPGKETSFFYAEVEFETVEQAHAFVPPAFLGRDVTEEDYGMARYWEKTRLHLL